MSSSNTSFENMYTNGQYLANRPGWHIEHSGWKAMQVLHAIRRNDLSPKTICEVGCGAGEVLRQMQLKLAETCTLTGYEISPQAYELCQERSNENLNFILGDFLQVESSFFDLLLVIDVIEHLENYFALLRHLKNRSQYKIFHIPLDLSVQTLMRSKPILDKRAIIGHIHYFTKEIALQLLADLDYTIIDYFYTTWAHDLPAFSPLNAFMKLPRKIAFTINQDLAVRLLGGYSLMVLAE